MAAEGPLVVTFDDSLFATDKLVHVELLEMFCFGSFFSGFSTFLCFSSRS
jgi:hypothetical protein